MFIVYLVVALLAIYWFSNYKYVNFLICYLGLLTDLFMLDKYSSLPIKGDDICLFINIILVIMFRNRYQESENTDISTKWIRIYFIFFIFEYLFTIVTKLEYVGFATKVARTPLFLIGYYAFRVIPLEDYKQFLKYVLYITIVQGVLYYLQFVGINLLAGYNEESTINKEYSSALNTPLFLVIVIFLLIVDDKDFKIRFRNFLLIFCLGMILMRFVRSGIIVMGVSIIYYIWLTRASNRNIFLIIIIALITPIAMSIISTKDATRRNSTLEEIKYVMGGIDNLREFQDLSGSFAFRLAMLVERIDYLVENPKYLLTGIGMVHEDSPNCYTKLHFILGTRNEGRYNGKCMIQSGDNAWVPIVLRYGLLGTILHISLFVILIWGFRKRDDWLLIFAPVFLYFFLGSFEGSFFERASRLFIVLIALSILNRVNNENNEYQ